MAEERAERRLAAILAADVVGYSRLMGEDDAGTLARLKQLRQVGRSFQQLDEVETVIFCQVGADNALRPCGRSHGLFDLLHELLNLEGCSLSHLSLQHPDTLRAFAVSEEKLDRPASEEAATH